MTTVSGQAAEHFARRIVQRLHDAGHIAYFAGGCVRDRLMHRTPSDFDVATSARPEQVLALFPRARLVGAAFGVVLVQERQPDRSRLQVEVATFRADGAYSDGRHPDSVRFTTPEEDARRRDFTCNGLFLDPLADADAGGQLHDYVGGREDIEARRLRAIGTPAHRFAEDHLRMLRAVRFAARLAFTIDPATSAAIDALQADIARMSRERIGEEIRLMLEHPTRAAQPIGALPLLARFPVLFAEVFGLNPPPPEATWPLLSNLPATGITRPIALMALLRDLAGNLDPDTQHPNIRTLRARLMLSNEETDLMHWLSDALHALDDWPDLTKAAAKRLMANPGWPALDLLFRADPDHAAEILDYAERMASLVAEGVAPPRFITGETLIALGAAPGPLFKKWLEILYDRQLDGELLTPESARAAAERLIATNR